MATETAQLNRRAWLALAAAGTMPLPALAAPPLRFAAAWDDAQGSHVGVLQRRGQRLNVGSALAVPTRAHGLLALQNGALLAVARRPGDWMVQWRADTQRAEWFWIEPGRAFTGHAVASADGRHVYTTETELDTGHGLVGVRHAHSLEKISEWPTHGADPHELVLDRDGSLLVANGGIVTQPESGRQKLDLDRMDSSLVRLDGRTGELRGQWRLASKRLSIRHLVWSNGRGRRVLGIALQSEDAEPTVKAQAAVLALFNGTGLEEIHPPEPLAGYGGDIAWAGGLFAVSCPRAHGVALFDDQGRWQGFAPLVSACALGRHGRGGQLWVAGAQESRTVAATRAESLRHPGLRMDNHWLSLA